MIGLNPDGLGGTVAVVFCEGDLPQILHAVKCYCDLKVTELNFKHMERRT
jgi:hypothetical protein